MVDFSQPRTIYNQNPNGSLVVLNCYSRVQWTNNGQPSIMLRSEEGYGLLANKIYE